MEREPFGTFIREATEDAVHKCRKEKTEPVETLLADIDDRQASIAELFNEILVLTAAVAGGAEKAKNSATVEEESERRRK